VTSLPSLFSPAVRGPAPAPAGHTAGEGDEPKYGRAAAGRGGRRTRPVAVRPARDLGPDRPAEAVRTTGRLGRVAGYGKGGGHQPDGGDGRRHPAGGCAWPVLFALSMAWTAASGGSAAQVRVGAGLLACATAVLAARDLWRSRSARRTGDGAGR
jgi:hypothetical protein